MSADVQKVMSEIDREVDRIPSFPALAEDPQIQQITFREAAIRIGIIGPSDRSRDAELRLRDVAERVRDEVLTLPAVSSASIMGTRPYQIDVEIPEATLRSYGLSLEAVAAIIRSRNIELPGGQLKADGQEILLRAKNKGRIGEEIGRLPLITQPGGVVLTVNDLGTVRDEFQDITSSGEINGEPAMVVNVERTKSEDLLAMVDMVRDYVGQDDPAGGISICRFGATAAPKSAVDCRCCCGTGCRDCCWCSWCCRCFSKCVSPSGSRWGFQFRFSVPGPRSRGAARH